jgi:hypothetical protein
VFGLAAAAGLYLGQFLGDDLHVGPATFYLVVNLLTTGFLLYVARRLWDAGATQLAIRTALITLAGTFIAVTYDFLPFGFDDADRTYFYIAALITWGTQGYIYFHAYRALHDFNEAQSINAAQSAQSTLRASVAA